MLLHFSLDSVQYSKKKVQCYIFLGRLILCFPNKKKTNEKKIKNQNINIKRLVTVLKDCKY